MLNSIHVLLVEDNPADVDLTREMLEASPLRLKLSVAVDGVAAIDFLRSRVGHAAATRPDLILLDLNLPRMDGRQVLSQLKQDASLRKIPVVVLSSSDAQEDVTRSYDLGANCYVTKPVNLDAFRALVRSVEAFWFKVVKLPSK